MGQGIVARSSQLGPAPQSNPAMGQGIMARSSHLAGAGQAGEGSLPAALTSAADESDSSSDDLEEQELDDDDDDEDEDESSIHSDVDETLAVRSFNNSVWDCNQNCWNFDTFSMSFGLFMWLLRFTPLCLMIDYDPFIWCLYDVVTIVGSSIACGKEYCVKKYIFMAFNECNNMVFILF